MEFFMHPQYRTHALPMYRELLCASKATSAEAQTNIPLKLLMLYDCAINITAHNVLFEDAFNTKLEFPGAIFRRANPANTLPEPGAERVVDIDGRVVASGGFLTHCNPPFGDVYMSVAESERGKGYDSYVIQEVKRVAMKRAGFWPQDATPTTSPPASPCRKPDSLPAPACSLATSSPKA
jgi:hypothetical protein